ncbi:MAG: dihydrolipoyl dehydrogenase [Bacteroidales bacterium]|jgi:dihydrolipoamide dehydrogenase|nr:dihydrolipoyl dehydrogenase [Bacteroidales bacterium]
MKYDMIVIGSGPGGYVAAIRGSQLGKKVAVIEQAEVGGICLNWGCIPTKALLKSAQVYRQMQEATSYGIKVEGNLVADFPAMIKRSRDVAATMSKGVQFLLKKNKIDLISGHGCLAGEHAVEVTNAEGAVQTYTAPDIIIATGARSRSLPQIPQDGKRVLGYREALSLTQLPERMVVIGSGAIGSEFACLYAHLGTKVTLVEYLPNIVPLEDEEISKQLERVFRKVGITVMTAATVEQVNTTGNNCEVSVKDSKGNPTNLACDVVLSAAGIVPNVENIGLENAGVILDKGKIVVDEYYRTPVAGVYAIGDIVYGPALAHVASHEALICVEHIAGLMVTPLDYNNIPACTYTFPEIASVGMSEKAALAAGKNIRVGKFPFTASGKATASGHRDGMVKIIFDRETDLCLGCHLIGENVTEMISGIVLARAHEVTGHDILHAIHPHPTLSEAIMEATATAYGQAIHL